MRRRSKAAGNRGPNCDELRIVENLQRGLTNLQRAKRPVTILRALMPNYQGVTLAINAHGPVTASRNARS